MNNINNINDFMNTSGKVIDDLYILESQSSVIKVVNDLKKYSWGKLKTILRVEFNKMVEWLSDNNLEKPALKIINRHLKSNYSSLSQLSKMKVSESSVNEGGSDWWKEAKGNLYGAFSFLPVLQAFLEFDKLIKGKSNTSLKVTVIYFILWIGIITGKVMKDKMGRQAKMDTFNAASDDIRGRV